ncbi:hypothetical protein P3T76_014932 [Phytophthora citrophthora]|uniref:Uncharacterized protein n=1 Tax=Phytophthora citrophthora TaxID=4793 RepID=A0AAD9G039_9STRA|nr:hypothetical protein P3T76_014932 [Phytophthora citrophthora]
MATAEEMLAFVDSFKWDEVLFGEDHVTNIDIKCLEPLTEAPASESVSSTTKSPPKRKRIRTGWSSSTGLQRRKRAELQFLRAHVKELEVYVEQLKSKAGQSLLISPEKNCGPIDWREVALTEFIGRKKSEEANRILRDIVGDATVLIQALNEVPRKG